MLAIAVSGTSSPDLARTYTLRMSSGIGAEARLRLQLHLVHAAGTIEVVHVQRAERALQRFEHIGDRHAERHRLLAIQIDAHLRHAGAERGHHAGELLALRGRGHELLRDAFEILDRAAAARLDVGLEAAGHRQAFDRRRLDRDEERVLHLAAFAEHRI